MILKNENLK